MPHVLCDFSLPISLSHDRVSHMQPATADKVSEKWQSMTLMLNRVITSWERSSHGDGAYMLEKTMMKR
jgi:hypothetical protein